MNFPSKLLDVLCRRGSLDISSLVAGDFAAAAVLISFGAVLGRATPTQLLWMAVMEVAFYSANEAIGVLWIEAVGISPLNCESHFWL